ncbi:MAG TPA: hypothetical protein VFQ48_06915, partial [Pseudonocardiaceae bacterium]|nr:hypothetical protein [Pseudonocardiaceae bacterium]
STNRATSSGFLLAPQVRGHQFLIQVAECASLKRVRPRAARRVRHAADGGRTDRDPSEGLTTGRVTALRRVRGLGGLFRAAISASARVLVGPGTVSTTARTAPTGKAHR